MTQQQQDQDPYEYGAQWRIKGDPEQTARIMDVFEDPDGHSPEGQPGAYVVITGDKLTPLYVVSVATFVHLFERPDGSRPVPSIPAQRTGD